MHAEHACAEVHTLLRDHETHGSIVCCISATTPATWPAYTHLGDGGDGGFGGLGGGGGGLWAYPDKGCCAKTIKPKATTSSHAAWPNTRFGACKRLIYSRPPILSWQDLLQGAKEPSLKHAAAASAHA